MKANQFISILKSNNIHSYTGVPCSVFKEVIGYLERNEDYLTASSEGEAMGIAAGFSLANQTPAVFMQNDGFGNAVNPLTSLQKIYGFPTLMVISWRGEPGKTDAPQHVWSGKTILDMLNILEIDYYILDDDLEQASVKIGELVKTMRDNNRPVAIICKKGIFDKETVKGAETDKSLLSREQAVQILFNFIDENTPVFSTTGKLSREIYKLKDRKNNFYVVGSMGCTSSIALGFNLKSEKRTIIIDGDGAILMKMGTLATIGYYRPQKFLHICLDNESYESTGGQPSVSSRIDLAMVAGACEYKNVASVRTEDEIKEFMISWNMNPELSFLLIKVRNQSDPDLPRPGETPPELKERFMKDTL
ncbi:MAG: phosphonopyruvate decarboxylase [Candidatus Aegiribacteria sp.]|nr:phosphonopyruvate decarboxylase [Candidatus Aegiribacteria sp.]